MTSTLTIRTAKDALDLVPIVLGFDPADSIVMLTFGGTDIFHARVDLPSTADDRIDMARALVDPCVRHKVQHVILAFYSEPNDLLTRVDPAFRVLRKKLQREGVKVIGVLHQTRGVACEYDPFTDEWGEYTEVTASEAATRARVELGIAPLPSKDALRETLICSLSEEECEAFTTKVAQWREHLDAVDVDHTQFVMDVIERGNADGPETRARLVACMGIPAVRDVTWASLTRENALARVQFWTSVIQQCPGDTAENVAAVLAFTAWAAGNGALAWLAVDGARAWNPENSLARMVAQMLEQAIAPSTFYDREF